MKKFVLLSFFIAWMLTFSSAQEPMSYFLPKNVAYNQTIPTPEKFFGQEMGEWHLSHDQILNYLKMIARISPRAVLQEYARTYENRPLVHLIFSSEENQRKLDELKALHVKYSQPEENILKEGVPLVVMLGYGVHGNESSATNSSVLTAYYLAAAQGAKIDQLLDNTIILIDPCLNPDGFTRHAMWANMHQSLTPALSNDSRQYSEVWPGGRTNHYWFDLNRDYLLLVHPESRGRVAKFYEWLPNIVTDHHEMGANSTFFFQPGVPSRNNPRTPVGNYTLTHKIAQFHAAFLDSIGSTYFSEEQFDDYYFGKGSSYPDVNGSIGILFEQAGFRGRIRQTSNGIKKLAFGIRNQFTVALSTLEAARVLKDELLNYQKEFYTNALQLAEKDEVKAYIFGSKTDKVKTEMFVRFIEQHQIDVFANTKNITKNGHTFEKGSSFVVPVVQKQYRLLKSLFEEVTSFADTTFYDVSTWTFPYAFDVPFAKIKSEKEFQKGEEVKAGKRKGQIIGGKSNLAYLFRWNEYTAPQALYQLQKAGLITKVATGKFDFDVNKEKEHFSYGTILIPVEGQRMKADQLHQFVSRIAQKTGINFFGLTTGLSPVGIDLGSNSFALLTKPEILMFIAGATSSRDAGEIWHLFDRRYQIPVTMTETNRIKTINLSKYNTIVLPGGSYAEWSKANVEKLKSWVQQGGTLIAYKGATTWAAKNGLGKTKFKKSAERDSSFNVAYANRSKVRNLNNITGAIFNTEIDISHPLCFGYTQKELPVFKTGTTVAQPLKVNYAEPVHFTSSPYISGFVSDKNLERIKNAPVVSVQSVGRGKLISYYENMTFRGIWLGTNKLFSNAVFFGSVIR